MPAYDSNPFSSEHCIRFVENIRLSFVSKYKDCIQHRAAATNVDKIRPGQYVIYL